MPVAILCLECGDAVHFSGRTDRRYCSAACRQRAYRHRQSGGDGKEAEQPLVRQGRQLLSGGEALEVIVGSVEQNLISELPDNLDLSGVDPALAADLRDQVVRTIRILRKVQRALDDVAIAD